MYTLQDIHQKKHTSSNFCLATHVLYNDRTLPINSRVCNFFVHGKSFQTILFKIKTGNFFCHMCCYPTLTGVYDKSGVLVFTRNLGFALLRICKFSHIFLLSFLADLRKVLSVFLYFRDIY